MASARRTIFFVAGSVVALRLLLWLGLQVRPQPFAPYPQQPGPLETRPLPAGLPAPVERFYRSLYGEEIPVIETVVIQGRGVIKPFLKLPIPARFVFVHRAGRAYRHYFEAALFGIPLLKVNEGYIDGESFFESPVAKSFDDPKANQGANLALWAEAAWFPSLWLTDGRARWAPVDEHSALLYVPFEAGEENFLVRFNPQTGLIDSLEAMRYRDLGEGSPKILWMVRTEAGQPPAEDHPGPTFSATWLDQGSPWANFNLEEVIFNTDVSVYLRQKGR